MKINVYIYAFKMFNCIYQLKFMCIRLEILSVDIFNSAI